MPNYVLSFYTEETVITHKLVIWKWKFFERAKTNWVRKSVRFNAPLTIESTMSSTIDSTWFKSIIVGLFQKVEMLQLEMLEEPTRYIATSSYKEK
jgi:hypothetical protein